MKKATLEDWQAIASQAKKTRNELFNLLKLTSSKLPNHINKVLVISIRCLDQFRSRAEDRMLKSGVPYDPNIFYGNKDNG